MAIEQLTITSARINDPSLIPPHADKLREAMGRENMALITADTPDEVVVLPDTLGAVRSQLATIQGEENIIISASNPDHLSTDLQTDGQTRLIDASQILDCLKADELYSRYGVDRNIIGGHGSLLLAGIIAAETIAQHEGKAKSGGVVYPSYVPDGGNSILWLGWLQHLTESKNPAVAKQTHWTSGHEGLQYQVELYSHDGEVGRQIFDDFTRKESWLPAVRTITSRPFLLNSPIATATYPHELVATLATGQLARETEASLARLVTVFRTQDVTFQAKDPRSEAWARVFYILMEEFKQGRPITKLTPKQYQRINSQLAQNGDALANGQLLPSPQKLIREGLIDIDKVKQRLSLDLTVSIPRRVIENKPYNIALSGSDTYLPEGLVPDDDFNKYSSLRDEIRAYFEKQSKQKWSGRMRVDKQDERPHYALVQDPEIQRTMDNYMELGVTNRLKGSNGDILPLNLHTSELQGTAKRVADYVRNETDIVIISPFAGERDTHLIGFNYGIQRLGANRVIAVDANFDDVASQRAKDYASQTGITYISENIQLGRINWEALVEMGIIQPELVYTIPGGTRVIPGLKGLSLLAGDIEVWDRLQRGEITPKTIVVNLDSDVKNTGFVNTYPEHLWYDPLLYMFLGPAFYPDKYKDVHSFLTAKSGRGRNNYVVFQAFDDMMRSTDPLASDMGYDAARLTWALTGERGMRAWMRMHKPHTNAMGIETMDDLSGATLNAASDILGTAQGYNPVPKIENNVSKPHREHGMIQGLALFAKDAKTTTKEFGVGPYFWNKPAYIFLNRRWGANIYPQTAPDDEGHAIKRMQPAVQDIALPSIQQMYDWGIFQ